MPGAHRFTAPNRPRISNRRRKKTFRVFSFSQKLSYPPPGPTAPTKPLPPLYFYSRRTPGAVSRILPRSTLSCPVRQLAMSSSAAAGLLGRQLKQMQSDKGIPGISVGLVNDNVFEWEVMLMISDDCRFYGGELRYRGERPMAPPDWANLRLRDTDCGLQRVSSAPFSPSHRATPSSRQR